MPGGKRARKAMSVAYVVAIALSLGVLLYLNIADLYEQYVAESRIEQIQQLYSDENSPVRLEYKRQAQLYNARLAGDEVREELMPYDEQLFYREEPMIAFIEIPEISVKLPIYHGTEENALMAGVGHWRPSSLPIGGHTVHCVLMGHTGMRNARMFDDLGRLHEGSKLVVWALNEPYAYEVYAIETVLPDQVPARCALERGSDLVTLVTCMPQGVNTHRLLVHARRCAYDAQDVGDVGVDAYVNTRNLPLLLAGCLAMVLAAATVAGSIRKRIASGKG